MGLLKGSHSRAQPLFLGFVNGMSKGLVAAMGLLTSTFQGTSIYLLW
jgi:hypothetical protein